MGLISLQKTPIVRATTAYEKFAFDDETIQLWVNPNATDDIMWIAQLYDFPVLIAEGNHPAVSGYLGQFVKYKFEDEIIVAVNKIAGSTLKDIRFALIFKLKGVGNEKFNIEDKYIYCKFWGFGGGEHHVPIVNPIYKALDEGLLKIYKYENNYTYIGTPELQANQLKDIVIEAPEKSDLFLRVIAIFESNKYKTPIIFQGDYLVDFKIEKANIKRLFAGIEQTNFHWDQYYQGKTKITLNSKDSNSHTAGRIALNPNFVGKLGFSAKAINLYPSRGNTVIKNYEYACNKNYRQSYTSSLFLQQSPTSVKIDQNETKLNIYPNPSCGNIVVYINDGQKIANITIFDSLGNIVYSKRNILQIKTNIDLGDLPAGIYFIRVTLYNHKTYSNTFLINK